MLVHNGCSITNDVGSSTCLCPKVMVMLQETGQAFATKISESANTNYVFTDPFLRKPSADCGVNKF